MSRAARDPLGADDLPTLHAAEVMVTEAPPDPPPGPIRDTLAAQAAARVDAATGLMDTALTAYNARVAGVVAARMRSPKTRKGTRWWTGPPAIAAKTGARGVTHNDPGAAPEVKSLDASYVLPERLVQDELRAALRPVALRIVADATATVARQARRPNVGLAAFDRKAVETFVGDAVGRMLEINERHARDVRREILDADATAPSLDAAIDRVMDATRRGGKWLLLAGRTLATALAGDAALAAARALGVTHAAWISRRDDRVRPTHVEADGQVRAVGEKYVVGGFRMRFPADPEVLPAGAGEVWGCRCGLIWAQPDPRKARAVALAGRGTPGPARTLLATAVRPGIGAQTMVGSPDLGAPATIPVLDVPADVVGYRVLDAEPKAVPGQRISWPGALALGLAAPVAADVTLSAVLPAGTPVGVSGGAAVLAAGTQLEVLSVTGGSVVTQPVSVVG